MREGSQDRSLHGEEHYKKSHLGEKTIIQTIQNILGGEFKPDDVGYAATVNGTIVTNIDTLVQSTDIPPSGGLDLRRAARKSVVACVSDFAAKGARPKFGAISLNLADTTSLDDITDIASGLRDASNEYGIRIVAGDTNAGQEMVCTVCLFGEISSDRRRVGRGGALPGDLIFVSGPFGYTALGLEMLLDRNSHPGASETFATQARRSVTHPVARLEFGLACVEYFSSSMDSSDGLAATLSEMAQQSGHVFEINRIPASKQLIRYAASKGLDLKKLVFYGGEEYEIVFTVPKAHRDVMIKRAVELGAPIIEIGNVRDGTTDEKTIRECSVYLNEPDGTGRTGLSGAGWDHFG